MHTSQRHRLPGESRGPEGLRRWTSGRSSARKAKKYVVNRCFVVPTPWIPACAGMTGGLCAYGSLWRGRAGGGAVVAHGRVPATVELTDHRKKSALAARRAKRVAMKKRNGAMRFALFLWPTCPKNCLFYGFNAWHKLHALSASEKAGLNRRQPLHGVRIALYQADQQGRLRVRPRPSLLPILQGARIRSQVAGEHRTGQVQALP